MPEPHSFGIKIEKENDGRLAVFVGQRQIKTTPKAAAVLACLHENAGRVVSYERLGQAVGFKSMRKQELHVIRQYISWIRKTLAAHRAPCSITVAPKIGYALCRHE